MVQLIRYDASNENIEALKGTYGQEGQKNYSVTVIKNLVFVIIYSGSVDITLPTVYDGFLRTSTGRTIQVRDSKLKATMGTGENASGTLALKVWN